MSDNRSAEQAQTQLESIKELVAAVEKAEAEGSDRDRDEAVQRINEDPLSVEVRSGWYTPGSENVEAAEFKILLCTGGPAVQIIGTLDGEDPDSAEIQHQDWGTPWTKLVITRDDEKALLKYARQFYFGRF